MKKIASLFFALVMLISQASAISLYVDDNKLSPDPEPVVIENRVLVPMRIIFEALNAKVDWNAETQTATAEKEGITVAITLNQTTAMVNGEAKTLDVPATAINNRTFVPTRFVSEALKADVQWDGETQSVYISTKPQVTTPAPETPTKPSVPESPSNSSETRNLDWQDTVWVTPTGERYHLIDTCGGENATKATLKEAKNRGLTPCNTCAKYVVEPTTPAEPSVPESPSNSSEQVTPTSGSQNTVWVTPTGKRYHLIETCGGKNATPTTLEKAQNRGLTPCNKCAK